MSFELARSRLLADLDAVCGPDSAMAFQKNLADELCMAEVNADPDARWHRHLLRLLGDALAGKLLSRHVLRELNRDGHPSASLTGQGDDFSFVIDVARRIADSGAVVPVIADLTHLIGVGDVIAVAPRAISIIECKNRTPPAGWLTRGRPWRQQQRGVQAASYLTDGYVLDGDGTPCVALEAGEAHGQTEALRDCIERARASAKGTALTQIGERDFLLGVWARGLDPSEVMPDIRPDGWRIPAMAGSGTAVSSPGPFTANPYALPLPAGARLAMAEGELVVFRFVDLGLLHCGQGSDREQVSLEVYRKGGRHHLRAWLDGVPLGLSSRFIDQVLWDYRSLADTRSMLVNLLTALRGLGDASPEERVAAAAAEVRALYGFAYRNPDGSAEPVIVSQLGQLANLGISVPFDELAVIGPGAGGRYIHGVIRHRERGLVMRLDEVGEKVTLTSILADMDAVYAPHDPAKRGQAPARP